MKKQKEKLGVWGEKTKVKEIKKGIKLIKKVTYSWGKCPHCKKIMFISFKKDIGDKD